MLQVIVDSFFFIVRFNPVVILFKTVHPEFKLLAVFKFHLVLFLFNENRPFKQHAIELGIDKQNKGLIDLLLTACLVHASS